MSSQQAKKTTNKSTSSKEFKGAIDVKNTEQVQKAMAFLEGMGFDEKAAAENNSETKIANVLFEQCQKQVEVLKPT